MKNLKRSKKPVFSEKQDNLYRSFQKIGMNALGIIKQAREIRQSTAHSPGERVCFPGENLPPNLREFDDVSLAE